jgi:hypothetical protein
MKGTKGWIEKEVVRAAERRKNMNRKEVRKKITKVKERESRRIESRN